jgi:hypothetical protein
MKTNAFLLSRHTRYLIVLSVILKEVKRSQRKSSASLLKVTAAEQNISCGVQQRNKAQMRDRRLPLWLNAIIPSSRLLRCVGRFRTDVSGLPICPIFKSQALEGEGREINQPKGYLRAETCREAQVDVPWSV